MIPTESELSKRVHELCKEGYSAYDKSLYKEAIRHFFRAWTLIPKPQHQYPEAGWVLTALGDAYFRKGDNTLAIESLSSAIHCANIGENPFIQLRLGQAYYESNEMDKARQHFQLTIDYGGNKLFEAEEAKYLELLEAVL